MNPMKATLEYLINVHIEKTPFLMAYKRGHFDGVELLELIRMLIIKME